MPKFSGLQNPTGACKHGDSLCFGNFMHTKTNHRTSPNQWTSLLNKTNKESSVILGVGTLRNLKLRHGKLPFPISMEISTKNRVLHVYELLTESDSAQKLG